MRDFRAQVVQRPPELSDISDLLLKGQLTKALRKAKAAGIVLRQEEIDSTAQMMYNDGRSGELLSMIGAVDVGIPYDAKKLLIRTYEKGDHHTFLKQAYRLRIVEGLEIPIQESIAAIDRRAPKEASVWRLKFSSLTCAVKEYTGQLDVPTKL